MSEPTQPHDKLFKALTDDPQVAGTLIREQLPPDIAALLADAPPNPVEGGFIDKNCMAVKATGCSRCAPSAAAKRFCTYWSNTNPPPIRVDLPWKSGLFNKISKNTEK